MEKGTGMERIPVPFFIFGPKSNADHAIHSVQYASKAERNDSEPQTGLFFII